MVVAVSLLVRLCEEDSTPSSSAEFFGALPSVSKMYLRWTVVVVNVPCSCTSEYLLAASTEGRLTQRVLAINSSEVW